MDSSLGKRLQVLLVEDNPDDARLFREYLEKSRLGADLHWAQSLPERLGAPGGPAPDVLVVALHPSAGAETRAIREVLDAAPSTPLVAVTGP